MVRLKIHSVGIVKTTHRIDDEVSAIRACLEHLEETASRLGRQWHGEASEAFSAAHREWSTALAELERIVRLLTAAARDIAARSDERQRRGAAVWGG